MRKAIGIVIVIAAGWGAAFGGASGCGRGSDIGSDCPPEVVGTECCPCPFPEYCPDPVKKGVWTPKPIPWHCPNACDGPPPLPPKCFDGGADGGVSSLCPGGGACVDEAPGDWGFAAFFSDWGELSSCTDDAPILAFEGTPAPPPPFCGECSCDEPEGTCRHPETWTVSSAACNDPGGGVKTNFDPPTNWDGTCNQDKAMPSATLCGGVPCVRSITISPPVIEEQPCKAHTKGDPEPKIPKLWNGGPETPLGRVCTRAEPWPGCPGQSGKVCGPAGDSSSCIYREGEHLCPEGWGGERHVLYGMVKDERECSACTCEAPTGGTCTVLASVYSAPACSLFEVGGNVSEGMVAPCHDFMPGIQLSGKTAELLNYTKGICAPSGGEIVGELTLDKPATVCCRAATS